MVVVMMMIVVFENCHSGCDNDDGCDDSFENLLLVVEVG